MLNFLKERVAVGIDAAGGKKVGKSAVLSGVTILIMQLILAQGWIPDAWRNPEAVAVLTAGVAWALNTVRKILLKQAA